MKNKQIIIFILIILILILIIIYQAVTAKRKINDMYAVPITLLNTLIQEKQQFIGKEKIKYISDLTEYCIKNNTKDSVNEFLNIISLHLPLSLKNNVKFYYGLDSKNNIERTYSYKFLEFIALTNIITKKKENYFEFDNAQVCIISNAQLNNNTLNIGDDYEAYIMIAANNVEEPIKVFIEGEKEMVLKDKVYAKYKKHHLEKGEHEIKGFVTFPLNGEIHSFNFVQKYTVK